MTPRRLLLDTALVVALAVAVWYLPPFSASAADFVQWLGTTIVEAAEATRAALAHFIRVVMIEWMRFILHG